MPTGDSTIGSQRLPQPSTFHLRKLRRLSTLILRHSIRAILARGAGGDISLLTEPPSRSGGSVATGILPCALAAAKLNASTKSLRPSKRGTAHSRQLDW